MCCESPLMSQAAPAPFRRNSMSELVEYLQREYRPPCMSDIYAVDCVATSTAPVQFKARIVIIRTGRELEWSGPFGNKKAATHAAADLALIALRAQGQGSNGARR